MDESSKRSPYDGSFFFLISCLKAVQKKLHECSVLVNDKVLQATQRQEKEDAARIHEEMQMLEENTIKCIIEMRKELTNSNSMIETTNSGLNTLERYNLGIKKEMHALMLSIGVSSMEINQALEKVQEAVNKCQEVDMEKHSFEEDLSTIKHEKASLLDQFEERESAISQLILQSERSEVEVLIRGIPQNEKDEVILSLTSHLKTLQKGLQGWSDWENKKVMEVIQRLAKDQAELKMLRQEKEDAKKDHQEMPKLIEMEKTLAQTNSVIETASSSLNSLEKYNVEQKRMHALTLSTDVHAMNVNNALAKEQEAVKKCQAADMEKRSFDKDLSTFKLEKAALQQQQDKVSKLVDQFEVLLKQEERVKQQHIQQADSLKAKREQLCVKGEVEQGKIIEKIKTNMQRYKEETLKHESEISQLRSKGIAQKAKDLAGESSGSNVVKMKRECVMCMNAQISVVFLPCAHQVLCEDCNVLHRKKGMDECPSCRTPIVKRISVRFAG